MSPKNSHFIGIDFGTSNTSLCFSTLGVLDPNPVEVHGEKSFPTAVLWSVSGSERKPIAFGKQAVDEWEMATAKERKGLKLSVHFKPDMTLRDEAKVESEAFLAEICEYLKKEALLPVGIKTKDIPAYLGIPAKILSGHDDATREVASRAGFGDPSVVKEPIGALIHHLFRKDIKADKARSGILVVDFGGGTCDVAYMLRVDVKESWGDPLLGGRLFDDLFYQWFLELNPEAKQKIEEDGNEYYVHWIKCQEMKERFSDAMARDRSASFRFRLEPYGNFTNASWEEFLRRAKAFVPTESFVKAVAQYSQDRAVFAAGQRIDLINWFTKTINRGITEGQVGKEDINFVIMTGGSSRWPFVRDLLTKELLLDEDKIFQSANPRGAIGEGVAMLPVLQEKNRSTIAKLRRERKTYSEKILKSTESIVAEFNEGISKDIANRAVSEAIRPAMLAFVEEGRTFGDLRRKIEERVKPLMDEMGNLIRERSSELAAKIDQSVRQNLAVWFGENGLDWDVIGVDANKFTQDKVDVKGSENLENPLVDALNAVVTIIVVTICGTVAGGAGTALIMSGPVGWLIGGFVGAVAAVGLISGGRKWAEKQVDKIPIWPWIRKFIFKPKKIEKQLVKAKTETIEAINKELNEAFAKKGRDSLQGFINDVIDESIENLSIVDNL